MDNITLKRNNKNMKVELLIDNHTFPVGSQALAALVEEVHDTSSNQELFDLLAHHPSTEVRKKNSQRNGILAKKPLTH